MRDPNEPRKQNQNHNEANGADLFKQKKAKNMKTVGLIILVYAIIAFIGISLNIKNKEHILLGLGVVLLFVCNFIWHMSERQYYSLPGSGSPSNHRCVFCGHRGIYRSTIYKTTTVRHTCSKCRTELYRRY